MLAVFGQKWANFEFSTKKRNGHFFTFMEPRVHEKSQKNLMRHFQNKNKQASDAGVSRQCLEDKMSKGARNVDIGDFYTTRPPEMGQNLVTWGCMTNENIEKVHDYKYFI